MVVMAVTLAMAEAVALVEMVEMEGQPVMGLSVVLMDSAPLVPDQVVPVVREAQAAPATMPGRVAWLVWPEKVLLAATAAILKCMAPVSLTGQVRLTGHR